MKQQQEKSDNHSHHSLRMSASALPEAGMDTDSEGQRVLGEGSGAADERYADRG